MLLGVTVFAASALGADVVSERLSRQLWEFPQEKIHVVTDRGAYLSGDTVRFRAFLVDAATHQPATGSEYVYVELADPFGSVVERVKIKRHEGRFAGYLPLPREMAEGSYTLSAYTLFMQNQGQEYFFRKPLPVHSFYSMRYRMDSEFNAAGDRLTVSISEVGSSQPVECESLTLNGPDGVLTDAGRKKSRYTFRLGRKERAAGVVSVKFDNYERFIAVPQPRELLHVSFHPEGGYMVPGVMNTVAFKAVDGAGRGVDVSGAIVAGGDTVVSFTSAHRGMGTVRFIPEAGVSYSARVVDRSYPLPSAEPKAAVLQVATNKLNTLGISAVGAVPDGAMLVAHNRGRALLAMPVEADKALTVSRDGLGEGIVQFLLLDGKGRTLSSRMVFNYPAEVSADSLPEGDYAVSVTVPGHAVADTANSIVAQLLLQSDLRSHVEDAAYYFRRPDRTVRAQLDALLLTQGWERYDIPSALSGRMSRPKLPMEIGGEITGIIKSRWRGKPMEGAQINLLAPTLSNGATAYTDCTGRFTVNGLDWPEGTVFAVQAIGPNGKREHNFAVDPDLFPSISPLPVEIASRHTESRADFYGAAEAHSILLNDIEVTAPRTTEENTELMFRALGIRSVDESFFEERAITTYEEALRHFAGVRVENGHIKYAGARGSVFNNNTDDVEIWVDGVRWTSAFAEASDDVPHHSHAHGRFGNEVGNNSGGGTNDDGSNSKRANHGMISRASMMTGGILRASDAIAQFMATQSVINELAGCYPFSIVHKIEFLRPSIALIVSSSAARNAGAILITTKQGSNGADWRDGLFVQVHTPLGFQPAADSYRPHYSYLENPEVNGSNPYAIWQPTTSAIEHLPLPDDANITISGLTPDNRVIYIEKRGDTQ